MREEPESIPIDEISNISAIATRENIALLKALAEFDERDEGALTGQLVGQYFTLRLETGSVIGLLSTEKIGVLKASSTNKFETNVVKAV